MLLLRTWKYIYFLFKFRYEVGAVILHSPLMSGMRVAFPATRRTWFFDAFPTIDKVPKVTSPVLVIHGTEDEVIDFSHGVTIYEKCPRAVEPLWVEVSFNLKQTKNSTIKLKLTLKFTIFALLS